MPRQPTIQIPCSTEALIEQVKSRPGLWSTEFSGEREARKVLWTEIARDLEPSFDTLKKYEVHELENNLRRRWRSLRDSYKREKRELLMNKITNKRKKQKQQFAYFDLLRFIDEHLGQSEMNINESDIKYVGEHKEEEVPPKKLLKKTASIQKHEPYEEEHIPEHTETITMIEDFDNGTEYGDTDKMFLLSFLPEMRSLPVNLKMWARAKISDIMQEAVSLNLVDNTVDIHVEVKQEYNTGTD